MKQRAVGQVCLHADEADDVIPRNPTSRGFSSISGSPERVPQQTVYQSSLRLSTPEAAAARASSLLSIWAHRLGER